MTKRLKGIPNLPFAPIVAALFGVVATVLVFATPAWLLERTVGALGISSFLAAARPPLGDTARLLIALATGALAFLTLWAIMRPVERLIHKRRTARGFAAPAQATTARDVPADGTRAPIFAGDELGAPFMSDEALASGEELFLEPAMMEQPELAPAPAAEPVPAFDPLAFELPPVAARANLEPDPDWSQPVRADALEIDWPQPTHEIVAPEIDQPVAEPELVETAVVAEESSGGTIEFVSVDDEPEAVIELPPIFAPEPVATETATPEPVALAWPVPQSAPAAAPEPAPVAALAPVAEPSLQDLLRRFESALDRRRVLAAQGVEVSEPPAFGTVASLRDLIESSSKNAA